MQGLVFKRGDHAVGTGLLEKLHGLGVLVGLRAARLVKDRGVRIEGHRRLPGQLTTRVPPFTDNQRRVPYTS